MNTNNKIKILLAIRQGQIGGGETHVLELAKHLNRNIYDIEVLSFTQGPMIDRLNEIQIPTHVIETTKPFDIKVWKSVNKLIKHNHYQIIHAHGTRAASNVFHAAKTNKIPFLYTVHGWSFHPSQSFIIKTIRKISEKLITLTASHNILVSKSNLMEGRNKLRLSKTKIIYNAIDKTKFNIHNTFRDIRIELGIPKHKTLVGYIVRMTKQKDPLTMVRAAAMALKQSPDLHFLFVGSGELTEETKALATTLGIQNSITFCEFRTDIPDILNNIDIYCLPSLWEGMPIGLMEAMSMKKPCIASAVDGTMELIQSNETGLLIPPGDAKMLSESILLLQKNKKLSERLAHNAHHHVLEKYSVEKMITSLEEVYNSYYNQNI